MKNLLEAILGIETFKNLGVVDTIDVGKLRYTTELGICRAGGQFALKVCVATRGKLSRNSGTLLWSLEPDNFIRIQADMQRILSALSESKQTPVSVNPILRGLLRLFGFRFLRELGEINLNGEHSKSYGFIAENSGVRFLSVKLVAPSKTSFTWIPQSAVQAIATQLANMDNGTANQALENSV